MARVSKSNLTASSRVGGRLSAPPLYPKPGEVGGRLIRRLISFLRKQEAALPPISTTSHILSGAARVVLACSGGIDSMALALLLHKYGRRVVAPERLELLHINHGWRGAESDADERFVQTWAEGRRLRVRVVRLSPPAGKGESLEAASREQRQTVYREVAGADGLVLTAHHADDLAETLLWRLCTGEARTHGGGIAVRHGVELRPLLFARKSELEAFLKEEKQEWREDRTNFEGRFLRSRLRRTLLPELEKIFPRAIENLAQLALEAQVAPPSRTSDDAEALGVGALLSARGINAGRKHREWIEKMASENRQSQLTLPGGWELRREPVQAAHGVRKARAATRKQRGKTLERWVLEREVTPS